MEQKKIVLTPMAANIQIANLCNFGLIMTPNEQWVFAQQNGAKSNLFTSIESSTLVILENIFCGSEN